jgi:GNAT superfamily N-acetyltransferase
MKPFTIRSANVYEYASIGALMVHAYSNLDGFIKPREHPGYYEMLRNVGALTEKPGTEIIVGVTSDNKLAGAVVYFNDMQYYASGGTATQEKNSAGFRLLAVSDEMRGQGVGKQLTLECIRKAKENKLKQVIIHTTLAMQNAWAMYERIGFRRSEDLDFQQGDMKVFGFRYLLE